VTALFLYDDARARTFEPFALTRPVSELRAGAELLRRRWEHAAAQPATGFVAAPHLADFEEFDAPAAAPDVLPAGSIVANARCVIALDASLAAGTNAWTCNGVVAAVRLASDLPAAELQGGALPLDALATDGAVDEIDGRWIDEVWDLVGTLGQQLGEDIPRLAARLDATAVANATRLGAHAVYVENGVTIEPFVVFDTTAGPVLLRRGATVQAFTRVVGPCYVGEGATIMADRIGGSAIGELCKVHGEVSASIFLGHSNKGHDGFVGHSYLGRWTNLGAGTTTSNLKNTYGSVALWTPAGVRDTGLQFLGTLLGDHAKTGIGLRLTTGCVVGAGANVVDRMPPKAVAPFSWGPCAPYDVYAADKFAAVAERVMARRGVTLSVRARAQLLAAHAARWSV
jgi:UDP-N-acetylglucosamine diphosphorylase/glucosamine-1-phosphate N-acetyltransferase